MKFFDNFPQVKYGVDDVSLTDITKRLKPLESVLKNISIYYDYIVRDGESPRILAHKIYGSEEYEWLILLFNRRLNSYFEWHMDQDIFDKYIIAKYGSIEEATQLNLKYYQIIQSKDVQGDGTIIPEYVIEIDSVAYSLLPANERRLIKAYDYEFQLNEDRRNIKIIDSVYIPYIMAEKAKVLNNV